MCLTTRMALLQQYWIQIPLISARDQAESLMDGQTDEEREPLDDTWKWSVLLVTI